MTDSANPRHPLLTPPVEVTLRPDARRGEIGIDVRAPRGALSSTEILREANNVRVALIARQAFGAAGHVGRG